jgi:hypothetical protein
MKNITLTHQKCSLRKLFILMDSKQRPFWSIQESHAMCFNRWLLTSSEIKRENLKTKTLRTIMKRSKFLLWIIIMFFLSTSLPLIFAERYEDNFFKNATIDTSGNFIMTNSPINDVKVFGVICGDDNCNSVLGRLWNGTILNSTNDLIQLVYPTDLLSEFGYGIYIVKEGYVPSGYKSFWFGTSPNDPVGPYDNYIAKKQVCHPQLLNPYISLNDYQLNIVTNITSPISHTPFLGFIPLEIENYFKAKTEIIIEIRKNDQLVYNDTKTENLIFSGIKQVDFNITLSPGEHEVLIYTTTEHEDKCLSYQSYSHVENVTIPCLDDSCNPFICYQNSDCGTDFCLGEPNYCYDDDVYQDYMFFTCNNPGLFNSFCSNSTGPLLIEDCGDSYCENYNNSYCKNNNVYHSRTCYDKGCLEGSCFSNSRFDEEVVEVCLFGCLNAECLEQEQCFSEQDCGGDNYSDNYCYNDNLYKDFNDYSCNNNQCELNITKVLVEECENGCFNNQCSDFEDNNPPIINLLSPSNNTIAFNRSVLFIFNVTDESNISNCSLIVGMNNHSHVVNSSNNISNNDLNSLLHVFNITGLHLWKIECLDNNNNYNVSETRIINIIENIPPECSVDLNCGLRRLEYYCVNDEVHKRYFIPKCVNETCIDEISHEFIKKCSDYCEDGRCKKESKDNDKDDDDNNEFLEEIIYLKKNIDYKFPVMNYSSINETVYKIQSKPVLERKYSNLFVIILLLIILIMVILIILTILKKRK